MLRLLLSYFLAFFAKYKLMNADHDTSTYKQPTTTTQ